MAALFLLVLWFLYSFLPIINPTPLELGQIRIYDRHDVLIAHLPKEDGFKITMKPSEPIPERLIKALIKVEDKRFYQHFGIDVLAKVRALYSNLSAGRVVSGGSTLTEQWIKNRYFRGERRTIVQKLRESTLAFYFSLIHSKDETLRNYLNEVYFGNQLYGLRAASYVYFDKSDLKALTQQEVDTLVTLLQAPSSLTSGLHPFDSINRFPHVTATVLDELKHRNDADLSVKTTIDFVLQEKAINHMEYSLQRLASNNVTNAAVYVFNPQNGEILVWQGSKDFYDTDIDGQVNVIEKKRQMGSALKPFIYLFAFLNGAHPDHLTVDLEKDFYESTEEDGIFRPLNYSLQEGGVITLKEALASSFNISAVRLLEYLGLHRGHEFLKTIGLELDHDATHYGLSLALGSPDLSLKNVAETYGTLANKGQKVETKLISMVNGMQTAGSSEQLLSESSATSEALFHLSSTLSSQVNRRKSFGLNSILNTSIPFAAKTGTTRNFKDNWTFGYRPDLVVGVWVGNNDSSSMIDVTGITGAAPIWHRVVEDAISEGFVQPNQIIPPDSLQIHVKCLDKDCVRKEVIYQNDAREWLSDLVRGSFCLEDFYIQTIEPKEIQKVAKLFDFEDFSIRWCEKEAKQNEVSDALPMIIKPDDGETFYIKKSLPIELQKIIFKATQPVDWLINEEEYEDVEVIFLEPHESYYDISINGQPDKRRIFIKYVD